MVGSADGCVRLSDLGVAAKLDRHFCAREPSAYATLQRRNTFIGSPAFMAPEVLCGSEQGCDALHPEPYFNNPNDQETLQIP